MDRKSIIVIIVCFGLMALWSMVLVPKYISPPKPLPPRSTNAPPAALTASNQPATPAAAPITPDAPVITTLQPIASTNVPEDLKELTNKSARYTFTSHGGGLKLIELLQYPETVSTHRQEQPHSNSVATLNRFTPVPTLALVDPNQLIVRLKPGAKIDDLAKLLSAKGIRHIDSLNDSLNAYRLQFRDQAAMDDARQQFADNTNVVASVDSNYLIGGAVDGDGIFTLTQTGDVVRAEKTLTNGLSIVKEFQPGDNYTLTATVRLKNTSSQPLALPAQEWFVGTAAPLGGRDKGLAVGVLWYNGAKTEEDGGSTYFASGGCKQRTAPVEYRGGTNNVVWVAAHNQFFVLAAMPPQPVPGLVIRRMDLPRPTGEEARLVATNAPLPQGYAAAMIYPALTLAPGQTQTNRVNLYAGPKEYQTLVRVADRFNNNLDLVMNFGWAGFVSKALLLGMNWLHSVLSISYGWAIVAITIIIKAVFWPLTQASTRSMKRMQALQPQMNEIKVKYKDDPVKMNKKTMEFMREHKVSPLGGCLPMALQIPVFFGFFSMIQSAIELRGAHFLWIGDLSQTDTLFVIPGLDFIPFFGIPGVGLPFNLLPLIMGGTMIWQSHLTPPSPGMDPTQQKMMRYMPLMFLVFLYNYSAGLTLYWTVQNLLTILQTKLTKMAPGTPAPAQGSALTPPQKKRK